MQAFLVNFFYLGSKCLISTPRHLEYLLHHQ